MKITSKVYNYSNFNSSFWGEASEQLITTTKWNQPHCTKANRGWQCFDQVLRHFYLDLTACFFFFKNSGTIFVTVASKIEIISTCGDDFEDSSDESSLQTAIMHFVIIAVYVDVLYIQNINTVVFLVSTPLVFGDVFTPSSIGTTLYFDNFSYFYFGSSLIEEFFKLIYPKKNSCYKIRSERFVANGPFSQFWRTFKFAELNLIEENEFEKN